MRFSKFLKDIFLTGFSQAGVLVMGVLLQKIMSIVLSKEYFGLFLLQRRWVSLLIPLLSLNVGLSITRFVSYDKSSQRHYFIMASAFTDILFVLIAIVVLMTPATFSVFLFHNPNYTVLTVMIVFFIYISAVQLNIFSYYRGKQEMKTANGINLLWFTYPVILAACMMLFPHKDGYTFLVYFVAISTFLAVLPMFIYFIRNKFINPFYPFKCKYNDVKVFMGYGVTRMPSSVLLSLIFLLPVFWASRMSTLEVTAYIGVAVSVLRMMELFSDPFNKVFLPKFAEFIGTHNTEAVRSRCRIVMDFIITFVPIVVIMLYGLSKYIVVFWVGKTYTPSVTAVKVTILCSFFYIAYALIRGILNGLYTFPYVNVISLIGLAGMALPMTTVLNNDATELGYSFGFGLIALGGSSIYILLRKVHFFPDLKTTAVYSVLTAGLATGLYFADQTILSYTGLSHMGGSMNIYLECAILSSYRAAITLAIFFLAWKKTLWFKELTKRINVPNPKPQPPQSMKE